MRKRWVWGLVLMVLVTMVIMGCEGSGEDDPYGAEAVIRDYYRGLANKDLTALQDLHRNPLRNHMYPNILDGLNHVELLRIREDRDEKKAFMEGSRGKEFSPENIRVFEVQAEFDYQYYASLYYRNGVQNRRVVLVREDADSPWLIEDIRWLS